MHQDQNLRCIPGPDGWPLLGNLLQLPRGNSHLELTRLAKIHGSVYKLKLASRNVLVVSDYDTIYEVLVKKGKDFAGRPFTWRRINATQGHLGISFSDPTDQWKVARKIVHSSLKMFGSGLKRIEQLALEITEEFNETFQRKNGKPVDPEPIIYSATIRMISLMTFGEKFADGSKSFMNVKIACEGLLKAFGNDLSGSVLDTFPWVRFLGNRSFKYMKSTWDNVSILWQNEVLDKLGTWDLESSTSDQSLPVAQALFAFENCTGKNTVQINDMFKKACCIQVVLAGVVSTTCSMLSLLNILVHHPDIQAKIQEEIDDVLGERIIGLDHQVNMPFTKATIFELHRYCSIVPINVAHKSLQDTTLADYVISKGTLILLNFWALHHDEQLWNDPFSFKPERFLDENGRLFPADHPNRKHLLAFSAGPRVCIGEALAQSRIFLWIVSLLQKFTLKPAGDRAEVPCDPRSYVPEFALKPQPYKMRLIARNPKQN